MKIKQLKLNVETSSKIRNNYEFYPADKNTENRLLVSHIFHAHKAMLHTHSDCADKVGQQILGDIHNEIGEFDLLI